MAVSTRVFLGLLVIVALLRLIELVISKGHQRLLARRGARKVPDPYFRWMVFLHISVLIGAAAEVILAHRPFIPALGFPALALFLMANVVRWWTIRTLGVHWNVQVMDAQHLGIVSGGPYRFVRHPNYAAVFVEMVALPLIHTAWITALAGSVAHVWVLAKRVALEERVLEASPVYRRAMVDRPRFIPKMRAILVVAAALVIPTMSLGDQVRVRHTEGLVHGFLALRTVEGTPLADGDLLQTARGTQVTSRLVFHFKDGSLHDETAVFSQRQLFRLVSDHLVQRGPSFPQPIDMTIDALKGQVTVRYTDDRGQAKVESEHLNLPTDLANGLILTMLKNADPTAPPKSVGYIAATPKPRLVKLEISAAGEEPFATGGASRKAWHYVLKVDIGGLSGVIAPLLGKQPPDSHVWILPGEAPAFVKSEQPLYNGGPVWRIELVSPVWPHQDR